MRRSETGAHGGGLHQLPIRPHPHHLHRIRPIPSRRAECQRLTPIAVGGQGPLAGGRPDRQHALAVPREVERGVGPCVARGGNERRPQPHRLVHGRLQETWARASARQ